MRLLGVLLAGAGALVIWMVLTGQSFSLLFQDLTNPQLLVSDLVAFLHGTPKSKPSGAVATNPNTQPSVV